MYCSRCGKEINDSAAFCPECGYATRLTAVQPQASATPPEAVSKANTAMIFAIIGLFFAGVICGIIAAVMGGTAISMANADKEQRGRSKAIGAVVLGIIDIVFGGIASLLIFGLI